MKFCREKSENCLNPDCPLKIEDEEQFRAYVLAVASGEKESTPCLAYILQVAKNNLQVGQRAILRV